MPYRAFAATATALVLLGGRARAEGVADTVVAASGTPAATASLPPTPHWVARLNALAEYRYRTSDSPSPESDQLLHLAGDLYAADPSGHWYANASFGLWWTAKRTGPDPASDPFGLATVHDAKNPWFNFFALNAEYQGNGALRLLRAGRQESEHGRPATFDGAALETRFAGNRLGAFAFGGRTQHFFEVTTPESPVGLFEDWIASAGLVARPSSTTRLEADYRYLREDVPTSLELGRQLQANHGYGAAAWWRPSDVLTAKVALRGIDSHLAEVSASGRLFFEEPALGVDARLFLQPVALSELDELDSPFFLTLGESLPFVRWHLAAYKAFAAGGVPSALEAHVGYDGRKLTRGSDACSASTGCDFNHNVGRAYAMLTSSDLLARGLSITVSVDRLADQPMPFGGKGLWALGGAVALERARLRAEVGTQFHLYEYVYLQDLHERDNVRAYYGDARIKLTDRLALRARYSVEIYDRVLHTATIGLSQVY